MDPKMMASPGYWKDVPMPYDDVLARVPEALKQEGFGIVTEIDMKATFEAKLGATFRRYRILGACNPSLAHAALSSHPRLGILLPCNVVVYEKDDGSAAVGVVDPMQTLGMYHEGAGLNALARDVESRLKRFLASFGA
ncbi:MAG: DUF302 domain-containing protein [Polyangiaceae bacterium]